MGPGSFQRSVNAEAGPALENFGNGPLCKTYPFVQKHHFAPCAVAGRVPLIVLIGLVPA
jgi:hypothetical protein